MCPEMSSTDAAATAGSATPNPQSHSAVTASSSLQQTAPASEPVSSSLPTQDNADTYESTHVHSVYDAIAPHFSSTRHSPWPLVATFLQSLAPGSIGLDVGCGNGKYLGVNPTLHILGSDRSEALVRLAKNGQTGCEVAVADGLALPYREGTFDFVICIAVVHHLSTQERRREAVATLLQKLKTGGKALVFVWALEQKGSRRGWDVGSAQDRMVPWVMRSKGKADETFQRYYHLYRQGELEEDVVAVGGVVEESGYERDNWWAIFTRP
ncbi:tRNA methyltransferase, has a role in tRNA modification [Lecanicillium sp. MT-2017a]|nr:tRNA methyltransferase, has a role in tRNA modification [Lecanicillium sp. MT-2017a]